jgi:hypothetical protein
MTKTPSSFLAVPSGPVPFPSFARRVQGGLVKPLGNRSRRFPAHDVPSQVFLLAHSIRFASEFGELAVQLVGRCEPEMMHVVSRRDGVDPGESRMLDATGEYEMPDQMRLADGDDGERHAHLKCDSTLLRIDGHRPETLQNDNECIEQLPDLAALAFEMPLQTVPAAKVTLVAVGESPPARETLPERCFRRPRSRHLAPVCRTCGRFSGRTPRGKG